MTTKSAKATRCPAPDARQAALADLRRQKMARSPHAYERGTAAHFYAWVESRSAGTLPEGPAVWICGDCHLGNLGPVADAAGEVAVQVRDLDQSVISGNPPLPRKGAIHRPDAPSLSSRSIGVRQLTVPQGSCNLRAEAKDSLDRTITYPSAPPSSRVWKSHMPTLRAKVA